MFENGTLKNRGNTWQPDGNWIFTNATEKNLQNEKWIRIKNKVDNKTLVGFGSKAIANETFVEGRHIQLWKRGQPNKKGYYSLQNSESLKFLTAHTEINTWTSDTDDFELKGKSILSLQNSSAIISMPLFGRVHSFPYKIFLNFSDPS